MRFISKFQRPRVEAIGQKWDTLANGQTRELEQGITAEFQQTPLYPWEEKAARERFIFTGTTEEDPHSGIRVDPIHRVSVFDTEVAQQANDWPDSVRKQVEQNLLKAIGTPDRPGPLAYDFMMVEKPASAKPWPTYDDFTAPSKIVEFIQTSGIDVADVIAYEQDNKNRASVLKALQEIESPTVVSA